MFVSKASKLLKKGGSLSLVTFLLMWLYWRSCSGSKRNCPPDSSKWRRPQERSRVRDKEVAVTCTGTAKEGKGKKAQETVPNILGNHCIWGLKKNKRGHKKKKKKKREKSEREVGNLSTQISKTGTDQRHTLCREATRMSTEESDPKAEKYNQMLTLETLCLAMQI